MDKLFLFFLSAYLILVVLSWRANRGHIWPLLVGHVLFLLALFRYIGLAFTPTAKTPIFFLSGIVAGQILFGVALIATKQSLREAVRITLPVWDVAKYYRAQPLIVLRFLGVALFEEFLWRVAVQTFLIASFAGESLALACPFIIFVALAFTMLHRNRFHDWYQRFEFVLFSLTLGFAYYGTGSYIFVVMIHAVRDIQIHYRNELKEYEALNEFVEAAHEGTDDAEGESFPSLMGSRSKDIL